MKTFRRRLRQESLLFHIPLNPAFLPILHLLTNTTAVISRRHAPTRKQQHRRPLLAQVG